MNSPFRDGDGSGSSSRPSSLRDRFRGKSSSEVLAELQDQFDKEREMFFQNRPFGNREMPGFGESPIRRSFFERTGFPEPSYRETNTTTNPNPSAPATNPAASSSTNSGEDPFNGRDSIPIKVIHEYTAAKPPMSSSPSSDSCSAQAKARSNSSASTEDKFHLPQKSASAHEVPAQAPRKPQVYQKSSSAGVKPMPDTVLREEPPPAAVPPKIPLCIQRSLDKIATVEAALGELSPSLDAFSGPKSSKDYLYLDEMLTRNLIKLDDVETHGDEEVRSKRKATVRRIQQLVELLESNAKESPPASIDEIEVPEMLPAADSSVNEDVKPRETTPANDDAAQQEEQSSKNALGAPAVEDFCDGEANSGEKASEAAMRQQEGKCEAANERGAQPENQNSGKGGAGNRVYDPSDEGTSV